MTMTFENLGLSVSALYAGGWRSGDANALKAEYELTNEEYALFGIPNCALVRYDYP